MEEGPLGVESGSTKAGKEVGKVVRLVGCVALPGQWVCGTEAECPEPEGLPAPSQWGQWP